MIPDDSIRAMIATEVHGAAERNKGGGSQKLPIPDRDEVLTVRCAHCVRIMRRPRRVVERDTTKFGFVSCSNPCKRAQLAKGERLLVPTREEASDDNP